MTSHDARARYSLKIGWFLGCAWSVACASEAPESNSNSVAGGAAGTSAGTAGANVHHAGSAGRGGSAGSAGSTGGASGASMGGSNDTGGSSAAAAGTAPTGGTSGAGGALSAGGTSAGGSAGVSGSGGSTGGNGGAMAGAANGGGGASSGGAAGSSGSGSGGSGSPGPGATFRVSGRHLYDRCGDQVVLRGVNEMVVWSSGKDGLPEFAEIAKTGANAVRIVWNEEGNASELDTAITNAVAQKLIPMVEHHGATGDLSAVPTVVDYWTRQDVLTTLKKHEPYLLLNIANEAGEVEMQNAFESTYRTAITRLRETGLELPLIIDAPEWGQGIDMLQAAGPALVTHDPEHNLMFSVHMWWNDPNGTRVVNELNQSVQMNLPLIVGEFAQHAFTMCDDAPFDYQTLLEETEKHQIGWLAWSWGGVDNADCAGEGSFDMTVGGVFGNWEEPWGEAVALSDPNSIQNTAVRPASMLNGTCN